MSWRRNKVNLGLCFGFAQLRLRIKLGHVRFSDKHSVLHSYDMHHQNWNIFSDIKMKHNTSGYLTITLIFKSLRYAAAKSVEQTLCYIYQPF
jgi:hypothetical protein